MDRFHAKNPSRRSVESEERERQRSPEKGLFAEQTENASEVVLDGTWRKDPSFFCSRGGKAVQILRCLSCGQLREYVLSRGGRKRARFLARSRFDSRWRVHQSQNGICIFTRCARSLARSRSRLHLCLTTSRFRRFLPLLSPGDSVTQADVF